MLRDADFDGGLDQEIWRATEHAVQRVIHNTRMKKDSKITAQNSIELHEQVKMAVKASH